MARYLRPGARSHAGEAAFRRRMWSAPEWGQSPLCYLASHCGHRILPGLGTIQHLLSQTAYPALRFEPSNVRPCHAGGKRRCPEPECDLDCQAIAASNTAPRDPAGRPLPFPPAYLAAKQAERAAHRAAGERGEPPSGHPGAAPAARPRPAADTGRPW